MKGLSLLALLVTVGCTSQAETMFTHQGQVMAQANGLVLSEDGQEGMAGMYDPGEGITTGIMMPPQSRRPIKIHRRHQTELEGRLCHVVWQTEGEVRCTCAAEHSCVGTERHFL